MSKIVIQILNALFRSLFISIVMFIIGLSVITGEFPPKLERLEKTYESLQQMAQLSN